MRRVGSSLSRVGLAIRLAAAVVWLSAGLAKLPSLPVFRDLVARYDIVPEALLTPFSYGLPFVQVGLGLYLMAGLFVRGSALVGTLLMATFLFAQIQAMARGIALECGCFGLAVRSTVGPGTLIRDVSLGLPTFLMLAAPARRLSLDTRLFGAPDCFAALLAPAARRPPQAAETTP